MFELDGYEDGGGEPSQCNGQCWTVPAGDQWECTEPAYCGQDDRPRPYICRFCGAIPPWQRCDESPW